MNNDDRSINSRRRAFAIARSYMVSGFARFSGLLVTLATTPWLLDYLGKENFGLWVILAQFFSVAAFTDFGLSNGLHNTLIKTRHTQTEAYNTILVQKTFFLMCIVSLVLGTIISLPLLSIKWASLFGIPIDMNDFVVTCIAVVLGIFYCNIPLAIISKVQFAYMDHHRAYAWDSVSRIMTLLSIYIGIQLQFSMPGLLAMMFLPLLLTNVLNIASYAKLPLLNINRSSFILDDPVLRKILSRGGLFFSIGIVYALSRTTDPLLIGTFGSLSLASDYQILFRLFDIPLLMMTMMTSIMWSAFAEAIHHRQMIWISASIRKICLLILATITLFTILYIIAGKEILLLWVGPDVAIDQTLWLAAGIWTVVVALYNLQASFLNASGQLKLQIVTLTAYLVTSVPAKIWALSTISLTGYILAGSAAFVLTMIIPSWLSIRAKMRLE